MLIECSYRRKGGTEITFDACDRWPAGAYHFKPASAAADAPHVADVTVQEHVNRFLSIPGYQAFIGDAPRAAVVAPSLTAFADKAFNDAQAAAKALAAVDVAAVTVTFDAAAIAALSVRDLTERLPSLTPEQIRDVLAEEEQRDEPRATVIARLTKALGGQAEG